MLSFILSVSPYLFSGKRKTSAFKLLQKSFAQTGAANAQFLKTVVELEATVTEPEPVVEEDRKATAAKAREITVYLDIAGGIAHDVLLNFTTYERYFDFGVMRGVRG